MQPRTGPCAGRGWPLPCLLPRRRPLRLHAPGPGQAFAVYRAAFASNGVDGATLLAIAEDPSLLDDLDVPSRLHRRKILVHAKRLAARRDLAAEVLGGAPTPVPPPPPPRPPPPPPPNMHVVSSAAFRSAQRVRLEHGELQAQHGELQAQLAQEKRTAEAAAKSRVRRVWTLASRGALDKSRADRRAAAAEARTDAVARAAAASSARQESALRCPITLEVMQDPVVDHEGNSYERSAIEQWLTTHDTSPVTRNPLSRQHLVPNRALRDATELRERERADEQLCRRILSSSDACLVLGLSRGAAPADIQEASRRLRRRFDPETCALPSAPAAVRKIEDAAARLLEQVQSPVPLPPPSHPSRLRESPPQSTTSPRGGRPFCAAPHIRLPEGPLSALASPHDALVSVAAAVSLLAGA